MLFIEFRQLFIALALLIGLAGTALAYNDAPELPAGCESVAAPAGNKVSFHVYAIGVQIYNWNGTSWVLFAPDAKLYADPNYRGKVGFHYGGPTWESNSGSNVVGARVADCSPDPTAIPWLRLRAVSTEGPGIFAETTFIQRVNTQGGRAPAHPGSSIGEERRIAYTTEYYFYRAED